MINRKSVKALICLGGVIREGNINEGIDEEIRIIRENGIPVFVVGSVGGRSSQIASEHMKKGDWNYEWIPKNRSESNDFCYNLDPYNK